MEQLNKFHLDAHPKIDLNLSSRSHILSCCLESHLPNAFPGLFRLQSLLQGHLQPHKAVPHPREDPAVPSLQRIELLHLHTTSKGATLKAETALSWSMPTAKVLEITEKMPQFKHFPGILPIGGGLPVMARDGSLIAAVGVAGGYIEQDEACAKAVVDAL